MKNSLRYFSEQELIWVPTGTFKNRYNLTAPDSTVLATLDMSNWNSRASAAIGEEIFFMRKESWYSQKINIYSAEEGPLIATYQHGWTGTRGQLSFPDGRSFRWKAINFWGTKKAWTDTPGDTIYVEFSVKSFSRASNVLIHSLAADLPELSLLVVLGFYNVVSERRAAAAAAASS